MAVFLLQFYRCAVLTFCREDVWTFGYCNRLEIWNYLLIFNSIGYCIQHIFIVP